MCQSIRKKPYAATRLGIPRGADNNAIKTPAIQAGAIIGSQSLMRCLDVYGCSQDAHDPDDDRSVYVDGCKVLDSQKLYKFRCDCNLTWHTLTADVFI